MRKITKAAQQAIFAGRNFRRANTEVIAEPNGQGDLLITLKLHGNSIAWLLKHPDDSYSVRFSLCGWPTPTTRERLEAALQPFGCSVYQKDHCQYIWDRNRNEDFLITDTYADIAAVSHKYPILEG